MDQIYTVLYDFGIFRVWLGILSASNDPINLQHSQLEHVVRSVTRIYSLVGSV